MPSLRILLTKMRFEQNYEGHLVLEYIVEHGPLTSDDIQTLDEEACTDNPEAMLAPSDIRKGGRVAQRCGTCWHDGALWHATSFGHQYLDWYEQWSRTQVG